MPGYRLCSALVAPDRDLRFPVLVFFDSIVPSNILPYPAAVLRACDNLSATDGGISGVDDEDRDLKNFKGVCRLFPLPGVVLFPHAVLPLHIFEPRYSEMTEDALAGDRLVAIVQVRPENWPGVGDPPIEDVACLGRILTHESLPDGRYNFLLLGRHRVRIVRELEVTTPYRQAEVEILDDVELDANVGTSLQEIVSLFADLARRVGGLDADLEQVFANGPPLGLATDLLAQVLGLPPSTKQALLAEVEVDRRASALKEILTQVNAQLDAVALSSRPFPPPFSAN